jgi:DNA-binding IclR family transcriptional regulator
MARPALSAARALKIVNYLAAHPGEEYTMSDLARNTGVNVASMHAVLAVLADEGYVMRDRGRKAYRLGLSPIAIGHAALERHPMIERLREETADLAERLGLECVATVTAGGELMFVAEAGSDERLHLRPRVGQRLPFMPPLGAMVAGASGPLVLEAWLDRLPGASQKTRGAYRRLAERAGRKGCEIGLVTPTRQAIGMVMFELGRDPQNPALATTLHALIAKLGRERHLLFDPRPGRTYAIDNIGVPVYDADGAFVAGFALVGFDEPFDGREVKRYAGEAMAAAARISATASAAPAPRGGRPAPRP